MKVSDIEDDIVSHQPEVMDSEDILPPAKRAKEEVIDVVEAIEEASRQNAIGVEDNDAGIDYPGHVGEAFDDDDDDDDDDDEEEDDDDDDDDEDDDDNIFGEFSHLGDLSSHRGNS